MQMHLTVFDSKNRLKEYSWHLKVTEGFEEALYPHPSSMQHDGDAEHSSNEARCGPL